MTKNRYRIIWIRIAAVLVIKALLYQDAVFALNILSAEKSKKNPASLLAPSSPFVDPKRKVVVREMENEYGHRGGKGRAPGNSGKPAATKVGFDQSPVPSEIVTEFIRWMQTEGAVISDAGNGLKVIKNTESVKYKNFSHNGYEVQDIGISVTFSDNDGNESEAYILRDKEGNRYVTEEFYRCYKDAPSNIKFQEAMHEIFEHEWGLKFAQRDLKDISQEEIKEFWDAVFSKMEGYGLEVDGHIMSLFRAVFTKQNIEGFSIMPTQDIEHSLAEITEKLETLFNRTETSKQAEIQNYSLNEINNRVRMSDLDLLIERIENAPLMEALEEALERELHDKDIVFDPIFTKFIQEHKNGFLQGIIELVFMEIMIFLQKRRNGAYPEIREDNLKDIIQKIINRWLAAYKDMNIEGHRQKGAQITTHYSAWENACKIGNVVIREDRSYISLTILGRFMGVILPLCEEGEIVSSVRTERKGLDDLFFIPKFMDFKGQDSLRIALKKKNCRACIQEMIDEIGWEELVHVYIKHRDFLSASDNDIKEFLQDLRDEIIRDAKEFAVFCAGTQSELQGNNLFAPLNYSAQIEGKWEKWRIEHRDSLHINSAILAFALGRMEEPSGWLPVGSGTSVFKGAYPMTQPEEYPMNIIPFTQIQEPISRDLAEEAVSVLNDIASKMPKLKETLIDSLIDRIRDGRVFFGKHFTKPAVAEEFCAGGETGYFIAVNSSLKDALEVNSGAVSGMRMRGIFLACILLGQEAQIYLRANTGADWDSPEFNSMFIAQAAELQAIYLYRDTNGFLRQYKTFLDSLASNVWGNINLFDVVNIYDNVRDNSIDYHFLEGSTTAILDYMEILKWLARIELSEKSLKAVSAERIKSLLDNIGIYPVSCLNGVPPEDEENVSVEYNRNVTRGEMIGEDALKRLVKNTFITIDSEDGSVLGNTRSLGDLATKGMFGGLDIRVDSSARKIKVKIDTRNMMITVTVPAIKDIDSWFRYCDSEELFKRERVGVIRTSALKDYIREEMRDEEITREAVELFTKGDIKAALALANRRLRLNPKSFELILFKIKILTHLEDGFGEAVRLSVETLKNNRLFQYFQRRHLFDLIWTVMKAELTRPDYRCSMSIKDIAALADIAGRQLEIHERDIEEDIKTAEDIFSGLKQSVLTVSKGDENVMLLRMTAIQEKIRRLTGELEKVKQDCKEIAIMTGSLYFKRGHFGSARYWFERADMDERVRRHNILLSKARMSFAGGHPLTEAEIEEIFGIFEDIQKENPVKFSNLAEWAYYLYIFWRHRYPERRKYLEEAEKRYEQYIAVSPVENNILYNHLYCLGFIKHNLGKDEEAVGCLRQFFAYAPQNVLNRPEYAEGTALFRKLISKNKKRKKTPKSKQASAIPKEAIEDMIRDFLEPFAEKADKLKKLSEEDRNRFVSIYLSLVCALKQHDKAYAQACRWLDELYGAGGNADIDLIEALVKIAVLSDKENEVKELLQERLAAFGEKDLVLDYARALVFSAKGGYASALKILNQFAQKYEVPERSGAGTAVDKIFANIFVERAVLYRITGQFIRAKRDWEYIMKKGWRDVNVCRRQIAMLDQLNEWYEQTIAEICGEFDAEQYPAKVIDRINEILLEHPHNAPALRKRNYILSRNGRFEDAEKEYRMLMEIYPDDLDFKLDLASCALAAGSPKAYEYYREYLKSGGDIDSIRYDYAEACFIVEKYGEVIEHFTKYLEANKKDTDNVNTSLWFMLAFSYEKQNNWEKAYEILITKIAGIDIEIQTEDIRKDSAILFISCCRAFVEEEEPDWDKINKLKEHALRWSAGIDIGAFMQDLEELIELRKAKIEGRKAEQEKEKDTEQRKKRLRLMLKKLRSIIQELQDEIIEKEALDKAEIDFNSFSGLAESEGKELGETGISQEIERIKGKLPAVLEAVKARIKERNSAIVLLKEEIEKAISDLTNPEILSQSLIDSVEALFKKAGALKIENKPDISRLLEELKTARDLAVETIAQRKKERILDELNERFNPIEEQVNQMITELQDMAPGEDPETILDRYRDIIIKFSGSKNTLNFYEMLAGGRWPEKFKERIKHLDSLFMRIYSQVKSRKTLKIRDAFWNEIQCALKEMESKRLPSNGDIIAKRDKLRKLLLAPIRRVLDKYGKMPDFRIRYSERKKIMTLAERKIAELLRNAEEKEERKRREAERQENERQRSIQKIINEWSEMIREELKKAHDEVDFDLIRKKGEELAKRLEEEKIYLTYEEAFYIQEKIYNVICPDSGKLLFLWEKVYPAMQAVSMSKKDSARAQKEVDECFKIPEIDEIDRDVYRILKSKEPPAEIKGYMERPASSIKRLLRSEDVPEDTVQRFWAYWRAGNNWIKDKAKNDYWDIRLGLMDELIKAGRARNEDEIIMTQIHLLKERYADDPENEIDRKSPDYAQKIAVCLARRFSGKSHAGDELPDLEFLYNLRSSRLKFVPRTNPAVKSYADDEATWDTRILDMHRSLTPDETRDLVRLTQKGNPFAMDVLMQAHAVTVKNTVNTVLGKGGLSGEYMNNGFISLTRAILRYGKDKLYGSIKYEDVFGLHRINSNFLVFIRMPIVNAIVRNAKAGKSDVSSPLWPADGQNLLYRAQRQALRDIAMARTLSRLLEMKNGRIIKAKKDIELTVILEIAVASGLKPLEVLSILMECPVTELYKIAVKKLAGYLELKGRRYPETLKLLAGFTGRDPMPEMVSGLNAEIHSGEKLNFGKIKQEMDRVFAEILDEKNKDWKGGDLYDITPVLGVFFGRKINRTALEKTWWIERRLDSDLKDLDEDGLINVYKEYFERIYKLIISPRYIDFTEDDIADIVEWMILMTPEKQNALGDGGISGFISLDDDTKGEGDTPAGSWLNLTEFTDQRTPEDAMMERERLDAGDLSPEQFAERRRRVLSVLQKLEERIAHERKSELSKIRPEWERMSAEIEKARMLIAEIKQKLEKARSEYRRVLDPIRQRIRERKESFEADIMALNERHKTEKTNITERHQTETSASENKKDLQPEERRAHWTKMHREIIEAVRAEQEKIEGIYASVVRKAEEKAGLSEVEAKIKYENELSALDKELTDMKTRHMNETQSMQINSEPERMEGLYPIFPEEIKPEMGSVEFNKDLWLLLWDIPDSMTIGDLRDKVTSENREVFLPLLEKLIDKSTAYLNFNTTRLICTVFIPLCFDKRIWELMDSEGLELTKLNARLNLIIKSGGHNKAELSMFEDGSCGVREAEIFSKQISILIKIVDKYKMHLARQNNGGILSELAGLRQRQEAEIKAKEAEIKERKEEAERLFSEVKERIESEKASVIDDASQERASALGALEEKKRNDIKEGGENHKRWRKMTGGGRLKARRNEELTKLRKGYSEEKNILTEIYKRELAPIQKEYDSALAGLKTRTEAELRELAEAVRSEEGITEDMRHTREEISGAIAELKRNIEEGDTEDDRKLEGEQRAEWEELVFSFNEKGKARLELNGNPHWDESAVKDALHNLFASTINKRVRDKIIRYLESADRITIKQTNDRIQLKEKHEQKLRELAEEENELRKRLAEKQAALAGLRERLYNSEKYLAEWLKEEQILLQRMEMKFKPLDARYRHLEDERTRPSSMFLDFLGLSPSALESGGRMTLDTIAKDTRYRKPDGSPLSRERVRQILRKLRLQILVFPDFDETELKYIEPFETQRGMQDLLLRMKKTASDETSADELGKFYLSRTEIIRLLRTIIQAQEEDTKITKQTKDQCREFLRLFIANNQDSWVNVLRIAAEISQQLIDSIYSAPGEEDKEILLKFKEQAGELRIELLKTGAPADSLKPYERNINGTLSRFENRFSEDYNPVEDFPYFDTTDKNWLSREEIIRLALTWARIKNLKVRKRIGNILKRFIEEQDEYYPDAKVQDVVKELCGFNSALVKAIFAPSMPKGAGAEKAPGSREFGAGKEIIETAEVPEKSDKKIIAALGIIEKSNAPRTKKIKLKNIVIHTVPCGQLLGIPRFKGARCPKDLIYTHGEWDGSKLHIYITEERWNRIMRERIAGRHINWLAQSIDHEWFEHVEAAGKKAVRHQKASERAHYFANEGQISPYHFIYLAEFFSYIQENPDRDILKWVFDNLLFEDRSGKKDKEIEAYEKLFRDVIIIKLQKLLWHNKRGGIEIEDKDFELKIRRYIWEITKRYSSGREKQWLIVKGVITYSGRLYLDEKWGETKFKGYRNSGYELEIIDGVSMRVFFEKDNSVHEFLKIIDNKSKKVIGVRRRFMPDDKFSQYEDITIETYLTKGGELNISGGRPDVKGNIIAKSRQWGKFQSAPYEKVKIIMRNGIVHRCASLESDLDEWFSLVWDRRSKKYNTSFFGGLSLYEFNCLDENYEIHHFRLSKYTEVNMNDRHGLVCFNKKLYAGKHSNIFDLRKTPKGETVITGASVIDIVDGAENILSVKKLSLLYDVCEDEKDPFAKGGLAGAIEKFSIRKIKGIFGRENVDFIASRVKLNRRYLCLGGRPKEIYRFPNAEVEARFIKGRPRYVKFVKNEEGFPILDKELKPLVVDLDSDGRISGQIENSYYGEARRTDDLRLTEDACGSGSQLLNLREYFPNAEVKVRIYEQGGKTVRYVKIIKDKKGKFVFDKYGEPIVVNLQEDIEGQLKEEGFDKIKQKEIPDVHPPVVPEYNRLEIIGNISKDFYLECVEFVNTITNMYLANILLSDVNKNKKIIRDIAKSKPVKDKFPLGRNSARYLAGGEVHIVFDEDFIKLLMKYKNNPKYTRAVKWIFMERYLHELCHDNVVKDLESERKEEIRVIIENDLPLYEKYVRGRELEKETDDFWQALTDQEKIVIMHSKPLYRMLKTAAGKQSEREKREVVSAYVKRTITETGYGKPYPAIPEDLKVNGDEKAPGSREFGTGKDREDYFGSLLKTAKIPEKSDKKINAALEIIKSSNAPRSKKINLKNIIIHTVPAGRLLGIPRFKGAHCPKDLICAHGEWDGGKMHIYITEERWNRIMKERYEGKYIKWLAQSIDYEWFEHVEAAGKTAIRHQKASERARYFANEGQLSPYHFIYLTELFSYIQGNPDKAILKWVFNNLLFENRGAKKDRKIEAYEKLFRDVIIIKLQKLLCHNERGGIEIEDKDFELKIRRYIWEITKRYSSSGEKQGHVIENGTMHSDVLHLGKKWGRFHFDGYKGSKYELEIIDGVPVRIFFEKDNSTYEFLKVIDNKTKEIIGVHRGFILFEDRFSKCEDITIETYLDNCGILRIGRNRPNVYGEIIKKEAQWGRFKFAPHEKVKAIIKNGIVHRCTSSESDLDEWFALVWDKKNKKYNTSFFGGLSPDEFNRLDENNEIHHFRLDRYAEINMNRKHGLVCFNKKLYAGRYSNIFDLRKTPKGETVITGASVIDIVDGAENILSVKKLSLLYDVCEDEKDPFAKGGLAGAIEKFSIRKIKGIFGRENVDTFDGAQTPPFRAGTEAPLSINPEHTPAFRPESQRVDFIASRVRLNRRYLCLGGHPIEIYRFPDAEVEVRFIRNKPRYVRFIKNEEGYPVLDKELKPLIIDLDSDKRISKQIEDHYYGGAHITDRLILTEEKCKSDSKLAQLRKYFPDAEAQIRRYRSGAQIARYIRIVKDRNGRDVSSKYGEFFAVNLEEDIEEQLKEVDFERIERQEIPSAVQQVKPIPVPGYNNLENMPEMDNNFRDFYLECYRFFIQEFNYIYLANLLNSEPNKAEIAREVVKSEGSFSLGCNSARYLVDGVVHMVFDEDFIKLLMKYKNNPKYTRAVKWIFMERYLHELCHDNVVKDLESERKEEIKIIMENDLPLYGKYVRGRELEKETDDLWQALTDQEKTIIMRSKPFYQMLETAAGKQSEREKREVVSAYVTRTITETGYGKPYPATPEEPKGDVIRVEKQDEPAPVSANHPLEEKDRGKLDINEVKKVTDDPNFISAVEYFNTLSGPLTLENIMDLYEIMHGEERGKNKLRDERLKSLRNPLPRYREYKNFLDLANSQFDTEKAVFEKAIELYLFIILKHIFVDPLSQDPLSGFERTGGDGHHRIAWFVINYFLINNGCTAFYFKDKKEIVKISYTPANISQLINNGTVRKVMAKEEQRKRRFDLIDELKDVESEKRLKIAHELGLDTRPIQSGLLDAQYAGYDMAVKNIVNPNNGHKVAVYACPMADISGFLLSTNADTAYFVDITPVDVRRLRAILENGWDSLDNDELLDSYRSHKYFHGCNLAYTDDTVYIEQKILLELKSLGVESNSIIITGNSDNSVTIRFEWGYKGQPKKEYSITYIMADILYPEHYPPRLNNVLRRGIDFYYQKAGERASNRLIPRIAASIKAGGYFLIDNFNVSALKNYNFEDVMGEDDKREQEIYLEEIKRWICAITRESLWDRTLLEKSRYGEIVYIKRNKKTAHVVKMLSAEKLQQNQKKNAENMVKDAEGYLEKDKKTAYLLAIDTDIFKGRSAEITAGILTRIKDLIIRFDNLAIITGGGEELREKIKQSSAELGNTIIIAYSDNLDNGYYNEFSGWAVIADVSTAYLDDLSYIPLIEIIDLAFLAACRLEFKEAYEKIMRRTLTEQEYSALKALVSRSRLIGIVLPPAAPYSYDELKGVYSEAEEALRSA